MQRLKGIVADFARAARQGFFHFYRVFHQIGSLRALFVGVFGDRAHGVVIEVAGIHPLAAGFEVDVAVFSFGVDVEVESDIAGFVEAVFPFGPRDGTSLLSVDGDRVLVA